MIARAFTAPGFAIAAAGRRVRSAGELTLELAGTLDAIADAALGWGLLALDRLEELERRALAGLLDLERELTADDVRAAIIGGLTNEELELWIEGEAAA